MGTFNNFEEKITLSNCFLSFGVYWAKVLFKIKFGHLTFKNPQNEFTTATIFFFFSYLPPPPLCLHIPLVPVSLKALKSRNSNDA